LNPQPTDYKSDRGRKAPIPVVPEFEAENRVKRGFQIISKVYRNHGEACLCPLYATKKVTQKVTHSETDKSNATSGGEIALDQFDLLSAY